MKTAPFFAVLMLCAVGCGPYLQYKTMPPAASPAGKIIVDVRDSREPKAGGTNHEQVGMQTGSFGIPSPIRIESPTKMVETMHQLVSEAALAAGVGVATSDGDPTATARVIVDVQRFWCTGYNPVYKGDITASVSVLDPAAQQVRVPGQPVHSEDGGMNCRSIFRKALTDFFVATRTMLSMPPVVAAATGANTQAAPPPAQ
jgi:hypothetical protein